MQNCTKTAFFRAVFINFCTSFLQNLYICSILMSHNGGTTHFDLFDNRKDVIEIDLLIANSRKI